jgi:hypothetical protein
VGGNDRMAETDRFRINRPDVIHEVLEGELVIVNLKTGAYFTLDPVGADIWHRIDGNDTLDELVAALRSHYEGDGATIEAEVRRLVEELLREDLIVPHAGVATAGGRSAGTDAASVNLPVIPTPTPAASEY